MLLVVVCYCVPFDCKCLIRVDCIPFFVIHVWHARFPLNGLMKSLTWRDDWTLTGRLAQSSGAVWKSRWTSWAAIPNKPTVSVDVKQHFNQRLTSLTKDRPCNVTKYHYCKGSLVWLHFHCWCLWCSALPGCFPIMRWLSLSSYTWTWTNIA